MSAFDLEVFTDEWLLNPYQFSSLKDGVVLTRGQLITPNMLQPMGDITGGVIGITIRDPFSASFTPITFDSNGEDGANVVIDDATISLWHYNISNSNWTTDLVNRSRRPDQPLVYSLVYTVAGSPPKPKRMWGGCFRVRKS